MIRYRGPQGPWEPYFAWVPTQDIHGRWHWLRKVYRRSKNRLVYPDQGWEFGTIFDVLRDA